MSIPRLAAYFCPGHSMRGIRLFDNQFLINRFGKTGPATAGIKLIGRYEKWFTSRNIDIDSFPMLIPVLIAECRLRGIFLRYGILYVRKFILKSHIIRLCINRTGISFPCQFKQFRINMAITAHILIQIILMIFFRSIKINEWHHLDGDRLRIVFCQILNGSFDHRSIIFIDIINARTIL